MYDHKANLNGTHIRSMPLVCPNTGKPNTSINTAGTTTHIHPHPRQRLYLRRLRYAHGTNRACKGRILIIVAGIDVRVYMSCRRGIRKVSQNASLNWGD